MKVVFELPERFRSDYEKNKCKDLFDALCTNDFGYVLRKAFENSTPIPNECGTLVDANAYIKDVCIGFGAEDWCDRDCANCELVERIKELFKHTVVKAVYKEV